MNQLRSIAFALFFYGLSVPIVLGAPIAALFGRRNLRGYCNGWLGTMHWSARTFLGQMDQTIKNGRQVELDALIVPGELVRFTRGIVGTKPDIWTTTVLRTEQLDANRLVADVSIVARELGNDRAGTAVLILVRVGGSWKLGGIEFFEVR